MKKVYIIRHDESIDFVFSSRKQALKQLEFIKNAILSGNWFIDKNGNYIDGNIYKLNSDFSCITKNVAKLVFENKETKYLTTYDILEKYLNNSYGI